MAGVVLEGCYIICELVSSAGFNRANQMEVEGEFEILPMGKENLVEKFVK